MAKAKEQSEAPEMKKPTNALEAAEMAEALKAEAKKPKKETVIKEKKVVVRHKTPRPKGGRGKKYKDAVKLLTKKLWTPEEAMELLPKLSTTKFDASAELHIRINADTTQADQLVRTTVNLPHGSGKSVRIAAFVPDDLIKEAKAAGAHKAGNDELLKEIEGGTIDFDVTVAVPAMMKNLGKVAKVLGQRGLMPSPKSGTVTENVIKAIEELKKGRIECKMDKFGIIHAVFGKMSFGGKKLLENFRALMQGIEDAKPAGIKGEYIMTVTAAPTMGPSTRIQWKSAAVAAE